MDKVTNNKAWFLVLPVFLLVAFSAVVPLMTVVNYSLQDIFDANTAYFVETEWYKEMLNDERLQGALFRQFGFSFAILLIEVPLGILVALAVPAKGRGSVFCMIVLALPLLIPLNVVGTIWQIFGRADIGPFGWALNSIGINYNYAGNPVDAWFTVLLIGVLIRFMDSFMIYTEPFVLTGGGPGNSTTFLSQGLTKMAIGQFDIGPAAAFSIIYFLIILLVCWVFYTAMTHTENK
jgi:glycerol transport system permease protein